MHPMFMPLLVTATARRTVTPFERSTLRYGPLRNAPCFCGSGRKFKKCHGQGGRSRTPLSAARRQSEASNG